MTLFEKIIFPDNPPSDFFRDDRKLVVVGIIGKSSYRLFNKMAVLNILNVYPTLLNEDGEEGRITFYSKKSENILYVHFETTYDNYCMQKDLEKFLQSDNSTENPFMLFNNHVRNRFARMFLFATEICHIIVFLETSITFDASLLQIFKCLKIIREKHVLKFLPKFVKNSTAGSFLGKDARLCSPRVLFFFENYPDGYDDQDADAISKLEFEVENNIYKMLRNEFIITNNSSASLFSVPLNNRFVYYNTDKSVHEDPLMKSINYLNELINKSNSSVKSELIDDLDELRPYEGFGKPLKHYTHRLTDSLGKEKKRTFLSLLDYHVDEAHKVGFDDNMVKYKTKNHFVIPTLKAWYDTFKLLHKIFIENPDNPKFEANDPDYKSYLENFYKIMDIDEEFFAKCCDTGLKKAIALYNDPMLTHYSSGFHKSLVEESMKTYLKYARGPHTSINEKKLKEKCDQIWKNGKQQCEFPSLRGNPCIKPKHNANDILDHSSGIVFVSTCNCGRTQGHREDPYTIRQANYEFYQILANNCSSCSKVEKIQFAVFEPSINDFKPAEIEKYFPKLHASEAPKDEMNNKNSENSENSAPLTASQRSHTNLSLESMDDLNKINCYSSDESVNELVIKVGEQPEENENKVIRQASTTEYLPGMIHTESPIGVLPQYPSWSLVCLGLSSVYSHNTGLLEHFQSGFLSGTNYLLPWDVHVRIEHSASWAAACEKTRYRKKGEVIILKIFVGCEYECPRGHRFIMSSPDKVLRGGSGIVRDSGSKVVFNDMPLYFPCPCKNMKTMVAQLMRVHIVTPKAPVNVILEPKVRTGDYIFTMGLPNPPKLSQSAYWVLRLPYIYQGDDGPIIPPSEVTSSNTLMYGCLLAGMYGVSETESEN
ncbi:nonsense-mediated mRNA decay factor SMG8 [Condylostylus longicornis]|uniref:nonsense-mediated mRNA decay factor SMG8 n=1 Tax=Condylostylus longicornis TaxID=2530218 RepID=UPI00244DC833|nr:nonsense-mediated mRNA decay factor SMG8 [Condylostylus longicornis]